MTMPVNYQKGCIPNHSGITINITNPVVNPPMNTVQNCCPQCSSPYNAEFYTNTQTKSEYPANYYINNYNVPQQQAPQETVQNGQIPNNQTTNPVIPNTVPYSQTYQQQLPPEVMSHYQNQNGYTSASQAPVATEPTQYNQNPNSMMPMQQYPIYPQTVNYSTNAPVYNNQYPQNNSNEAQGIPSQNIPQQNVEPELDLSVSNEIIKNVDTLKAEQAELEKNSKKTRIVALTNEYIMSLENYLNNPNKEIRLMAAKEVLTRLDEDRERFDDAALNALLNKMLQDPEKLVRILALSAFSSQLASGNDFTVELLQNIQNNPNADKEDVVQAAKILLKMTAGTEIKYVPVKNEKQKSSSSEKSDSYKQQVEQLQAMLQKYKERDIEAMLQQQQATS